MNKCNNCGYEFGDMRDTKSIKQKQQLDELCEITQELSDYFSQHTIRCDVMNSTTKREDRRCTCGLDKLWDRAYKIIEVNQ